MRRNPKNVPFKTSITEKEFLECLTYEEIFHLIVSFQNEKRKYFIKYLNILNKLSEVKSNTCDLELEKERNRIFELHLHYEDLVQWCFKETTKRTKRKNWHL